MKTLPHRGVRQAERIQLPAVPPFPRLTVTQAAAPKQVPAAQTSSSDRATCKLPPLQAAASASSGGGRAKSLGKEPRSQQELLPPLPCVSGERDRAVRAERREHVPHSPVAPAQDVEYSVRSFVSTVIRNAVACNEEAKSKARLSPSGRGPRTKGTPPLPTAVPRHLKRSRHPAPHSPTDSFTALQDTAQSVVSEVMSKTMAKMREQGQRPAALGDPAHVGCPVTATRSAGVQTDMESRWTAALPAFSRRGGARKTTASRDPAPATPGRVEKHKQERAHNVEPRQGSSKEGTSQGRGRKESGPVGWDKEEEIVIFNSWINPRFARLFQEPQALPPEEGSSSSTVDREAAAEEAENPTSASLGSSEPTDTALSAAALAEGPGEERHGTPLTAPAPAPAERTPASPPSAPICEDEGYRAPPQTPGGQESKPSACPCPSEHSTAVVVESQGRARHASSVSEEELDETSEIVVAAVLFHSVAIMQGATSKAPTAPSAAWPRVPPSTPEPVDYTAVDESGAVATPLVTVPGHQVSPARVVVSRHRGQPKAEAVHGVCVLGAACCSPFPDAPGTRADIPSITCLCSCSPQAGCRRAGRPSAVLLHQRYTSR